MAFVRRQPLRLGSVLIAIPIAVGVMTATAAQAQTSDEATDQAIVSATTQAEQLFAGTQWFISNQHSRGARQWNVTPAWWYEEQWDLNAVKWPDGSIEVRLDNGTRVRDVTCVRDQCWEWWDSKGKQIAHRLPKGSVTFKAVPVSRTLMTTPASGPGAITEQSVWTDSKSTIVSAGRITPNRDLATLDVIQDREEVDVIYVSGIEDINGVNSDRVTMTVKISDGAGNDWKKPAVPTKAQLGKPVQKAKPIVISHVVTGQ